MVAASGAGTCIHRSGSAATATALRRVVAHGAGWMPLITPEDVRLGHPQSAPSKPPTGSAEILTGLRAELALTGRDPDELDIQIVLPHTDLDDAAAVREARDAICLTYPPRRSPLESTSTAPARARRRRPRRLFLRPDALFSLIRVWSEVVTPCAPIRRNGLRDHQDERSPTRRNGHRDQMNGRPPAATATGIQEMNGRPPPQRPQGSR